MALRSSHSAVSVLTRDVFSARLPNEVTGTIIEVVTVQVGGLHPRGAWPVERLANHSVNKACCSSPFHKKADGCAVCVGAGGWRYSQHSPLAGDGEVRTPLPPVVYGAMKPSCQQ